MVSVVNWQPTDGLMVQADRLGLKVGGHLAPCCTLRVNQGELSQCYRNNNAEDSVGPVLMGVLCCTVGSISERR